MILAWYFSAKVCSSPSNSDSLHSDHAGETALSCASSHSSASGRRLLLCSQLASRTNLGGFSMETSRAFAPQMLFLENFNYIYSVSSKNKTSIYGDGKDEIHTEGINV